MAFTSVWRVAFRILAGLTLLIAVAITGVLINSLRIIVRRLMDGIDPATLEAIRSAAASSPGVREVGPVRARWTGHRMEADAVVSVDAHLDVIGAHAIAGAVEQDMRAACRNLDHVSVHVHPATPPSSGPKETRAAEAPLVSSTQ